jgi:hypothetical protein
VSPEVMEILRDVFAHYRWDGIVLLWNGFLTAAQSNLWMWGVLALWVLMAGRKGLLRLAKYVTGSFIRSEIRN